MTLQEFAALKTGDRFTGMLGTTAEVVETSDSGVTVRWENSAREYAFTAQSRAWVHWTKVETPQTA